MIRRRFTGGPLVIASHNEGKVAEIAELLAPFGAEVVSAAELGLDEVEETGDSFVANAELKARFAAERTGKPALADDSGLSVNALNGAPGIFSARWAGPERDFRMAMEHVERELGESTDRSASFICALCLAWPDGTVETVEGSVHGHLIWPPRGDEGFGYDPVFVPDGHKQTFGEMDPARKQAMSHRAQAFAALVTDCFAR